MVIEMHVHIAVVLSKCLIISLKWVSKHISRIISIMIKEHQADVSIRYDVTITFSVMLLDNYSIQQLSYDIPSVPRVGLLRLRFTLWAVWFQFGILKTIMASNVNK